MGEIEEIRKIYKELGKLSKKLPYWNMFIITSYEEFEDCFGEKASKNRKLYNGNLKCGPFGADASKTIENLRKNL